MSLARFLRLAASAPHRFGEWDCAMTLANWVRTLTGIDPAADLRGHYRTHLGWLRIVNRAGGLDTLVGVLAERAGLIAVSEVSAGDIGVVDVPTLGPAGAIFTGAGWAMKLNDGLTVWKAPKIVAAWGFR